MIRLSGRTLLGVVSLAATILAGAILFPGAASAIAELLNEPPQTDSASHLGPLVLVIAGSVIGLSWRFVSHMPDQPLRGIDPVLLLRLEAAPDGVVISETGGRIVFANLQSQRMFGYRADEMIGQSIEMLIPEPHRAKHVGQRAEFMETRRHRPMGVHPELTAVRSDGTELPVAIMLTRIEAKDQTLVIADIRDLTELREVKRQLANFNELQERDRQLARDLSELAAVNRELEAFSYSVSHDLRSPLRAIDGFSQALDEDFADKLDESGRDLIFRIRRATQRMGAIIDDLLKLSRITRAELEFTDVDIGEIAREIMDRLLEREPNRQVELTIGSDLTAIGDARLLRHALENLLNNAMKFTAGRTPARIKIGQVNLGDETPFFVSDNGAGFDMAYAGKLFGAFQRLHDAEKFPGTGVGLATVQRIIRKHGGRIWAEAEVDKGATFYFTL
jgi:PAS domain S-box-containing protein